MKYNIDCVRDVLLKIEEFPYKFGNNERNELYSPDLAKSLPDYDPDEVYYCLMLLDEAGFITGRILQTDRYDAFHIKRMTVNGHQFIETIRPPEVWDKTKSILQKAQSYAMPFVMQVASKVGIEYINDLLQ